MKCYRNQNHGFTLLELTTVALIVGVLIAIAIPNLLGQYRKYQAQNALRQLRSSVIDAQRQAKRRGKTCKIKFDKVTTNGTTRDRITVVSSSDPGETGKDYSDCLVTERIFPEFISLQNNIPGTTDKITFSPKGNTPTSGTIKLSASDLDINKCLVISNGLGIIRTGEYEASKSKVSAKHCKKANT